MELAPQYFIADLGNGNSIDVSSIRNFYKVFTLQAFSVKYVFEGTEVYTVNKKRYKITAGKYLLVNPSCSCDVQISSAEDVKGICIDISPGLLSDVSNTLRFPDKLEKPEVADFMLSDRFFENRYDAKHTPTGSFLKKTERALVSDPGMIGLLSEEFFMQLAEKLILDQLQYMDSLKFVRSAKYTTQKELLRCVLIGKEYMDDCFLEKPPIAVLAKAANISEYYFFRLFKSVFGVTPYQYMFEKRLLHAYKLMKQNTYSVYDVALRSGFADQASFSKAFKKRFGVTPSEISRI